MNPISIVIPIRIESKEREENLRYILSYLLEAPFVHIDILEADNKRKLHYLPHERIRYRFIPDNESVFYRTYYLNILLRNAEYPIVGIWDTDIIVTGEQVIKAIQLIEKGYVISFPYNGNFRLLNGYESILVKQNKKTVTLSSGTLLMKRPSVGGAFLVNKEKYMLAGGENEGFYGWGPEDCERVKRLEILKYPIARVEGPCYHLYHPQKPENGINQKKKLAHNQKMLLNTCNKTKEELAALIKHHAGIFSYMNNWNT